MRKLELKIEVEKVDALCDFCGDHIECFRSPLGLRIGDNTDICKRCVRTLSQFSR